MTIVAAALSPARASAQDLSDEWKYRAFIYMWMPQISGSANFPGGNTADIDVKFHTILDHLKMAGMGSLKAQKGRWGVFTDVVYVGAKDTKTRDGTIDGLPLPVGVTLNTGLDLESWIWTLAGSYPVQTEADSLLDVFAGARMLWLQPTLNTIAFEQDEENRCLSATGPGAG